MALGLPGAEAALSRVERLAGSPGWELPVLTYHRIAWEGSSSLDPAIRSADPETFEAHVTMLASERSMLSADDLLATRRSHRPLPPRAAMLTVDDAYVDFAEHAWPVLRRHRVPVTLFVPTAYPGEPDREFWWDRLHKALVATESDYVLTPIGRLALSSDQERADAHRRLCLAVRSMPHDDAMRWVDAVAAELGPVTPQRSVLDWGDLRRLVAEGVTIASHSRTHAMLDKVSSEQLVDELRGSRADLERELGGSPPMLCYPAGQASSEVEEAVADAGYEVAFSTREGINDLRHPNWLSLRRVDVGPRTTPNVLRLRMHRWTQPLTSALG